jgi:hypothetical protein
MSARRKLWDVLYALIVLLLAAGVLAVVWLSVRPLALPALFRWASESEPNVGPPPEAFDRIRRQQDEIADGEDVGPIRCTLVPSHHREGDGPADLQLGLTNTSDRPVRAGTGQARSNPLASFGHAFLAGDYSYLLPRIATRADYHPLARFSATATVAGDEQVGDYFGKILVRRVAPSC